MTSTGWMGHTSRVAAGGISFIAVLLMTAVTGCGGQVESAAPGGGSNANRLAAGVEECATSRAACKVGDISIGGGTVFYVEGEGDSKVVLEYAPAGWSGRPIDPSMNWEDAVASAEGYRLVGDLQWHLPMNSELKKLYEYWAATKAGEFVIAKESATDPTQYYWMFDCCTLWFMAGAIDFNTGRGDSYLASSLSGVRPIRGY